MLRAFSKGKWLGLLEMRDFVQMGCDKWHCGHVRNQTREGRQREGTQYNEQRQREAREREMSNIILIHEIVRTVPAAVFV